MKFGLHTLSIINNHNQYELLKSFENFQDGRHFFKMAGIEHICLYLSPEETQRHDCGGYAYIFMVKEANEIDNNDVSHVNHIDISIWPPFMLS